MIALGACGDVDFDFLPHLNRSQARGGHPFQRIGRLLAAQIVGAAERAEVQGGGRLNIVSECVPLPLRAESRSGGRMRSTKPPSCRRSESDA